MELPTALPIKFALIDPCTAMLVHVAETWGPTTAWHRVLGSAQLQGPMDTEGAQRDRPGQSLGAVLNPSTGARE